MFFYIKIARWFCNKAARLAVKKRNSKAVFMILNIDAELGTLRERIYKNEQEGQNAEVLQA